ncbi:MAG: GspH/FimT family pseudopilin [Xanthomonadales bacterium]|nr:GspH/FimT family pseudopilin [Xanthomonadales bacterium]
MHSLYKKNSGFTLIELITTLLIGALLLVWGVPNYRDFKIRKHITDVANQTVYSLSFARAEAVRYGTNVTVSPNVGGWQNGWTTTAIGVDGNPDRVLAVQEPIDDTVVFSQTGTLNGTITFNRIGGLIGGNAGRFDITNSNATGVNKSVLISLNGTSKVVKL